MPSILNEMDEMTRLRRLDLAVGLSSARAFPKFVNVARNFSSEFWTLRFAQFPEIGGFETWLSSNGLAYQLLYARGSVDGLFLSELLEYVHIGSAYSTLPPDPYRLISFD